jgi:hypothetical protein
MTFEPENIKAILSTEFNNYEKGLGPAQIDHALF